MGIDIEKLKAGKSTEDLLEFGIINIDKPSGPTSFDTSDRVKKELGLRKTSHFGTLDPKVTGVLPVALNRACKLTGFFLGEDKEYVGIMRLHGDVPLEIIKDKIKEKFSGVITQLPPVKSRVKRQEREREVKSFELIEKEDLDILFKTEVQGGTYIRKLCHDLGEALGVGAHMLELRRVRAGIFNENQNSKGTGPSVNMFDFEKAVSEYKAGKDKRLRQMIIPGEIVSRLFPVVEIKPDSVDKVFHGQPIYEENLVSKENLKAGEKITVFSKDKFIGIFTVVLQEKIFARPEFVLQPLK